MKILIIIFTVFLISCTSSHKYIGQNSTPIVRKIAMDTKTDFEKYKLLEQTAHFNIWLLKSEPDLAPNDLKILIKKLESSYEAIQTTIGPPDSSVKNFDVLLEGKSFEPGLPPHYPSVDDFGIIHLYTFLGPGSLYLQGLPHEIVHAFRNKIRYLHNMQLKDKFDGFGFIEEGFAEFVSQTIDPSSISFVNYGFPRQVVVGYWLTTNQDIPLEVLWKHHEINGRCVAQAYPLRASFFFYLEQEYGRDAVFKLANSQQKVTEEIFLNIFKKNLSTLVAEWRPWAIDQFNKISGNEQILKTWQDSTPIKFFPRCKPPFIP